MKKRILSLFLALVFVLTLLPTAAFAADPENHAPVLKAGVSPVSEAQVLVGNAYLLYDLQAGRIFTDPDGDTLNYQSYYYQRSTDGGQTWGELLGFSEAIFGWTTIQITELEAGTYVYRFYASDGKAMSEDTWTLTLHVVEEGLWDTSFYVGRDPNYSTNGKVYPVLKLYQTAGIDEETGYDYVGWFDQDGQRVLVFDPADYQITGDGEDYAVTLDGTDYALQDYHPVTFTDSAFGDEAAEGTTVQQSGDVVSNYRMYYASVTGGRYSYRVYGYNATSEDYDVRLGGMSLVIPTDSNVDALPGGGTSIYLRGQAIYTNSKKTDGTYFNAEEYSAQVDCPIMGCSAYPGTAYVSGNYTYYPFFLYAGTNSCLYNYYVLPKIEGYTMTQAINQTVAVGYSQLTRALSLSQKVWLTVTVPASAEFALYFQWNNFNTKLWEPEEESEENGQRTYIYGVSQGNGNYTWRLSDPSGEYVTKAGWLSGISGETTLSFQFNETDATDRLSHDFSGLGTAVKTRDEADLMVNLDPSGYRFVAADAVTRVRAYRHWEIINTDSGNIMIEPDFNYQILSGSAEVTQVDGGNTSGNWLDVDPDGTAIVAVNYNAIDVNPDNHGSHGGLFPATNPERTGVFVISDTEAGQADADITFHTVENTTRSTKWDYNYDTWFYLDTDTAPVLNFTAAAASGTVAVEYAIVTTDASLHSTLSDWTALTPDASGAYAVNLLPFRTAGTKGGTVILKLTDESGTSYRLVRVAEMSVASVENVTNPGLAIMPGDEVKLTFDGMYRAVNKISGVFNPTTYQLRYSTYEVETDGATGKESYKEYKGSVPQYQQMDNTSLTLKIPEDLVFAEDEEEVVTYAHSGYVYGSMYSAANPFAFLYNMTDGGVGTNFNAVTVSFSISRMADIPITVARKVTYDLRLDLRDADGALDGCVVTLTDSEGKSLTAGADGLYHDLGYGYYRYYVACAGHIAAIGEFRLDDKTQAEEGVTTLTLELQKVGANDWDGESRTEVTPNEDGVYEIRTGAELAWFAQQVNSGAGKAWNARLMNDISLIGAQWTPIGTSSSLPYCGDFDGNGHQITDLYINSTESYQGIFGVIDAGAVIHDLKVTGNVTSTGSRVGGIAGWMLSTSTVARCASGVDVTGYQNVGGIAGFQAPTTAVITDCYNCGDVTATYRYGGGISGGAATTASAVVITNCYSTGAVTGGSSLGAVTASTSPAKVTNSYYLEGAYSGTSWAGVSKTEAEMKAPDFPETLGENFKADGICLQESNDGYPLLAWQQLPDAQGAHSYEIYVCNEDGTHTGICACGDEISGDCADADYDGFCDVCEGVVPREVPAQDKDGVYEIATLSQLLWFQETVNGGNGGISGKLTADIDLSKINWTPIGAEKTPFTGSFDGNGHSLTGLRLVYEAESGSYAYQGFFGYVKGTSTKRVTIKNLTLSGDVRLVVNYKSSYAYSGALCGWATYLDVTDVTLDVDVSMVAGSYTQYAWSYLGGFGGKVTYCNFTRCYNHGDIDSIGNYVAGFCGTSEKTNYKDCGNTGNVHGNTKVGGFGSEVRSTKLTNCYNTGDISINSTGDQQGVGGLISRATYGTVLISCYNAGNVTGDTFVGGLVGELESASDYANGPNYMENCYNTGMVTGHSNKNYSSIGGLVGELEGGMNSYNLAHVYHCYNVGKVTDNGTGEAGAPGAAIGHMHSDYSKSTTYQIQNVYYLEGGPDGLGYITVGALKHEDILFARSVAEMRSEEMVAALGEAFQADGVCLQEINDGYPILTWQELPDAQGEHTYVDTVIAPGCETGGYTIHVCSACGDRFVDAYVPATGHHYEEQVVAPTCGVDGYTSHTCTDCGHNYRDDFTAALEHAYTAVVTAPGCETMGYTTHTCTNCGHSYTDSYVAATGHHYESAVTKEATCKETGVRSYTCADCGDSYTEAIPTVAHTYEAVVTAPTCDAMGYTTHTCAVCGESYVDSIVPAKGHTYKSEVTAPTCDAMGYTTHTCEVCGESYVDSYVDALEHHYEAKVTKEATCAEEGVMTFTCADCGKTYEEAIAKTAHTYEEKVTAPDCMHMGYTTHTCAVCGDSYRDGFVDAAGHDCETVAHAATCEGYGYTENRCKHCDYTFISEITEPTGHTAELRNSQEATCFDDGYTGDQVCAVCGAILEQGEVIPANCEHCPSRAYTDLNPDFWYHEGVDFVLRAQLMKGMSQNVFQPDGALTRAQLATILYRLAGEPSVEGKEQPFQDVAEGQWYTNAVIWAAAEGIVKGVTTDRFAPDDAITREQLAVMLYRYAGTPEVKAAAGFTDSKQVSDWAQDAMAWAIGEGILTGAKQEDGTTLLDPQGTATRAQTATILMRFLEK